MASGKITLSYTTTNNDETSATVSVTMTYHGNGQTHQSTPSSNNCYITLPGYGTKYFTHAYTMSTAAQEMGSVEFTISKTHSAQSLTATGGITNYSTVYNDPTGSCTISVDAKTSYTISYGANGHGTAPAAQTKWHGEGLVLQPAMSATGWTFVGWSIWKTATTARYNASGYYTEGDADATLYGIWQKDITLSYNANSGSGAPASQTNTIYNTTTSTSFTISSTKPTRTNYDFLGWLDGSTLYQPGDTISNVTDSKELVASWKLGYIPPQITSLEGKRLENDNFQATITINWTKGNNGSDINTTQLSIAYKLSTSSTWTYVTNTTGKTSSTETWISSTNTTYRTTVKKLTDSQYDIQIKVRNSKYTSYTQTKTSFISATFYVIDIAADGKGIGLLTTAPSGGINIGGQLNFINTSLGNNPLPIYLNGHEVEYITNQGTVIESTNGSGLWRYRKWNSGFQEVWYCGSVDFTDATSNSANGWYRRIKTFAIPYSSMTNITAFNYNAVPVVTGAYSGTLLSTGGFTSSGTAVELQEISGATISSTSIPGWSIYIAGMPR